MSEFTISSTTDSQEQVDAAADYDQQVGHGESPPSGGAVYVTSTTEDSREAVVEASRLYNSGETFTSGHERAGGFGAATGKPTNVEPRPEAGFQCALHNRRRGAR